MKLQKQKKKLWQPIDHVSTNILRPDPRPGFAGTFPYQNLAPNQLGMGGGIGGGLGYVLSNRLKNPNVTRHALMSVTFGIFGFNVVQFTGIKVIRGFHKEISDLNDF